MTEARKLVISLVVVIATLAAVGTWVVMGLRHADKLNLSIAQKRTQLTGLQEKIAAVPELRQERQKLGSQLDEYETILPNERDLNKILDTLSEYEKKAGLEIRRFTPVHEKDSSYSNAPVTSYRQVSYDLDLAGDYFSLVKFFNLLENHNRFVQVDTFIIKQKEEDSLLNEISVRVSTFVYDAKSAAEGQPKPAAGAARQQAPETPFDLKRELASRFVYLADARIRDPFTNPLTRRINAPRTAPTLEVKRHLSPEQEKTVADEIEKKLGEVAALVSDGKLDEGSKRLNEVTGMMDVEFRDADCARRDLGFNRTRQRLDILLRTARGEQLYKIAQDTYDRMLRAFNAEDYDSVFKIHATMKDQFGRGEKEVPSKDAGAPKTVKPVKRDETAEGEPIHERLAEVLKACDLLAERAVTRREFAGVGIEIQGTFWSGRGDNRKAAAIINGQMVTEGEMLKHVSADKTVGKGSVTLDGDIIVKKIDREKVTFAYKTELIEKLQFKQE